MAYNFTAEQLLSDILAAVGGVPTGGATEAKQDTIITHLTTLISNEADFLAREYETAGALATTTLGGTGAVGDYLEAVLIVPGTTAAGAVSIKDGADAAIVIFAGGATTPLSDLAPIYVPVGAKSRTGAWQIVTLANVTAVGFGNFAA